MCLGGCTLSHSATSDAYGLATYPAATGPDRSVGSARQLRPFRPQLTGAWSWNGSLTAWDSMGAANSALVGK